MRKHVRISAACLKGTLIPAALEQYHRETSGYLIGSNGPQSRAVNVLSAYPIQTDLRMFTQVMHGNLRAIKRVESSLSAARVRLLGGFHSHPQGPNRLSKSDLEFIGEKSQTHELSEWLEVLLSVTKKEYRSRKTEGIRLREYPKKLGLTVVTDQKTGYDVVISGFWVVRKGEGFHVFQEATLGTNWRAA